MASYSKYNQTSREGRLARRVRALMLLGGACEVCGVNDMRALQFDHPNGKGNGESGDKLVSKVFKNPSQYQILCANHNWIKRFERGEHRQHVSVS